MKLKQIITVMVLIIFITTGTIFAKTKKIEKKRFQIGLGGIMSTGNILGLIANVRLLAAMDEYEANNGDLTGLNLSPEQEDFVQNYSVAMQKTIMAANILASFEYGAQVRIKWSLLLAHADIILLPNDGSYNGRFDFQINVNAGVRAPLFIQPYITAGPTFTFSWYPTVVNDVTDIESWKESVLNFNNFAFRPGINTVVGLDLKFKKFSFGVYYKYTIKDFAEWSGWFVDKVTELSANPDINNARAVAFGEIFGYQSRFGAALTFYLF